MSKSNGIATPDQWRNAYSQEYEMTLPVAGVTIIVKKISMLECVRAGYLPAEDMMKSASKFAGGGLAPEMTGDDFTQFIDMLERLACIAVVNPALYNPIDIPVRNKLVPGSEGGGVELVPSSLPENAISVKDITYDDLMAIFNAVSGDGEDALKPFFNEQKQSVDDGHAGEAVQPETVDDSGNTGSTPGIPIRR